MEPWYKVATPRREVREGRSFNPDEFAIALGQVVAGTAPRDYHAEMLLGIPRRGRCVPSSWTSPTRSSWLPSPCTTSEMEGSVKITYDREVDALYIRFKETTVTTKHLAEGIAADYDAEGRLAGIEILDAVKRLGDPEVFRQVILEDVALRRT